MASGERDLTRGSVWRQVLAYAMPLVASSLLQALYSMVDTVIAGHFAGSAAISAINNSGQILNILTTVSYTHLDVYKRQTIIPTPKHSTLLPLPRAARRWPSTAMNGTPL